MASSETKRRLAELTEEVLAEGQRKSTALLKVQPTINEIQRTVGLMATVDFLTPPRTLTAIPKWRNEYKVSTLGDLYFKAATACDSMNGKSAAELDPRLLTFDQELKLFPLINKHPLRLALDGAKDALRLIHQESGYVLPLIATAYSALYLGFETGKVLTGSFNPIEIAIPVATGLVGTALVRSNLIRRFGDRQTSQQSLTTV